MNLRTTIALTAGLLTCAIHAHAQPDDAATCADRMRQALRQRYAPADSGSAIRRRMTVIAEGKVAEESDTVVSEIETIEGGDLNVMRTDSLEQWSDGRAIVIVNRREKSIRVVDLTAQGMVLAAQRAVRDRFRDSLVDHVRSIQCDDVSASHGHVDRITLVLDTEGQRLHNAASVTADVDEGGEIMRFAVTYPPGAAIRSTTYVVRETDRRYTAIDVTRPVIDHFFNADGTLRPEYTGYRMIR